MTLQNSSSWHVISLKIVISVKKYFIFAIIENILYWVFQWIIMASVQDPNSLRSLRVDPMWTRPHRKFQKNRIFSNRTKIRGLESRSKITSQGSISKSTRSCPVEIGHFGTSFIGSWFIPIFSLEWPKLTPIYWKNILQSDFPRSFSGYFEIIVLKISPKIRFFGKTMISSAISDKKSFILDEMMKSWEVTKNWFDLFWLFGQFDWVGHF